VGVQENGKSKAPTVAIRGGQLVFDGFTESDPRVLNEASRWTTGSRGAPAVSALMEGADLSPFASAALCLGAQVMSIGGETSGVTSLAGTVIQLADRAEAASTALTADVARATAEASDVAAKAAREAAKVTVETLAAARRQVAEDMAETVKAATMQVQTELTRLFEGDNTPIVTSVRELVAAQMADSAVRMQRTFTETLGSVSSTLDVGNPASPLARLEHRLGERQDRQHAEVTASIEKVREAVTAAATAAQTAVAVASVQASSPAKGRPFEDAVGVAMEDIASGLGGSYEATGNTVGAIRGCRKGDGVLDVPTFDGTGSVRIVVEMTTTGAARKWGPYLAEAERNREAYASIGVVPTIELVPGGVPLAPIAPNRIVVAHNNDEGHALLRAAAVLLALRVQRDAVRDRDGIDLASADARIAEAEQLLGTLSEVLKAATGVKTGAAKVITGIETTHEALARMLALARAALRRASEAASSGEAA
jgi:hypothetical protein